MSERLKKARTVLNAVERQWLKKSSLSSSVFPLGIPDIDSHLGHGGIEVPAVHEIYGQIGHGGSGLFALKIALSVLGKEAMLFLITPDRGGDHGELFTPALHNIDAGQVMMISPDKGKDTLWAFEECVASDQARVVIAEIPYLDLFTSRRLQLACEKGGCLALALCQNSQGLSGSSAARTRWRVEGYQEAWSLELLGGRGVRPGHWMVEYHATTSSLSLVSNLGDGSLPESEPQSR